VLPRDVRIVWAAIATMCLVVVVATGQRPAVAAGAEHDDARVAMLPGKLAAASAAFTRRHDALSGHRLTSFTLVDDIPVLPLRRVVIDSRPRHAPSRVAIAGLVAHRCRAPPLVLDRA